jgi:hypothetical protein
VVKQKKKRKRKRIGYSLQFKSEVMASYDNLRALKCKACTAIVVSGCEVVPGCKVLSGCECGCTDYYRDVR